MRWLETVLAPLDELSPERKRLLQTALALTLGAEAIITMKDVCRLDNDETLAVLRWAATALLRAALQDPPAPVPTIPTHPRATGGPRAERSASPSNTTRELDVLARTQSTGVVPRRVGS
jgi:hypothetical protein